MLLNNLDPEVAEHPEQLVVYGGTGRAARTHDALKEIVRTLLRLGDDETLLVQSGKPVGVFRTNEGAPRVLIANSLLVPRWATWDEFRRLEAEGLTMFGQMTAGAGSTSGRRGSCRARTRRSRRRREALRLRRSLGANDPHGRARRDGRRAAARGDDGRRGDPLRRGRSGRSSGGSRRAISTRRPTRSTTRSRACGPRPPRAGPCRWRCSGTPPTSSRSSRPRRALRPRHRSDRGARPAHRLRAGGGDVRGGRRPPRARPEAYLERARSRS